MRFDPADYITMISGSEPPTAKLPADANVEAFRRAEPAPGAPTLMVRSAFACMACHQE